VAYPSFVEAKSVQRSTLERGERATFAILRAKSWRSGKREDRSAALADGPTLGYRLGVTPFRPMPPPPPPFASPRGEQHLGQLAIGYYVLGGLFVPVAFIFVIYAVLGAAFLNGDMNHGQANPPPDVFGWMFLAIGIGGVLVGLTMAALTIFAGRCLATKKNLTFVYIMAGLLCTNMPLGTILGVLTFVVLSNDMTRSLFASNQPR
jgi:hypothetical protein